MAEESVSQYYLGQVDNLKGASTSRSLQGNLLIWKQVLQQLRRLQEESLAIVYKEQQAVVGRSLEVLDQFEPYINRLVLLQRYLSLRSRCSIAHRRRRNQTTAFVALSV